MFKSIWHFPTLEMFFDVNLLLICNLMRSLNKLSRIVQMMMYDENF